MREPLENDSQHLQHVPKMRYSKKQISYRISNCSDKKSNDISGAFKAISNGTTLSFIAVKMMEDISVLCHADIKNKLAAGEGLVHLGAGGPKYLTTKNFNIIVHGEVEIKRDLDCKEPIVEIHEILHALGYIHSSNPQSVMFPEAKCGQVLGTDIRDNINELYVTPNLPDLWIESVSVKKENNEKYIVKLTIKNIGLSKSESATLVVYDVDKRTSIAKDELKAFDIGAGREVRYIIPFEVNNLRVEIKTTFDELEKENNIKTFRSDQNKE